MMVMMMMVMMKMMHCFCGMVDRLVLFPAGTIVRDPHHRESPTRCEQGLKYAKPLEFRLS